ARRSGLRRAGHPPPARADARLGAAQDSALLRLAALGRRHAVQLVVEGLRGGGIGDAAAHEEILVDAVPSGAIYQEGEQATNRCAAPEKTGIWVLRVEARLAQLVTTPPAMVSRATMRRLLRDRRRRSAHPHSRAERDSRAPRRRRA